jgi:hypothetical protein
VEKVLNSTLTLPKNTAHLAVQNQRGIVRKRRALMAALRTSHSERAAGARALSISKRRRVIEKNS